MKTRLLLWAGALCAAPVLAQQGTPPTSPSESPPASQQPQQPQQPSTGGSGREGQQPPSQAGQQQAAGATSFRNKAPQPVVRAIEERTREWEQAFNRHDVDAMAAFFTADATLLAPDGSIADGKQDIERQLRADHAGPMRNARTSLTVRSVRALSPTLVLADLEDRTDGLQLPPGSATGGAAATSSNLHVALTAMKQGNTWKVVALRIFPAPSANAQGVGGSGPAPMDDAMEPSPPQDTPMTPEQSRPDDERESPPPPRR